MPNTAGRKFKNGVARPGTHHPLLPQAGQRHDPARRLQRAGEQPEDGIAHDLGLLVLRVVARHGELEALTVDRQIEAQRVHRHLASLVVGQGRRSCLRARDSWHEPLARPNCGNTDAAEETLITRPCSRSSRPTQVVDEIEGAVQVDVDGQAPTLRRVLERRLRRRHRSVVDECIAASELLLDTTRQRLDASLVAHVERDRQGAMPASPHGLRRLLDGSEAASTAALRCCARCTPRPSRSR